MCFVRISEQTANIKRLVFITEVQSVYSAVRTESVYKTDTLLLYRVNILDYIAYNLLMFRTLVKL
jgi:hypothetical protein